MGERKAKVKNFNHFIYYLLIEIQDKTKSTDEVEKQHGESG
ncbi:hypothetical protein SynSYN20_00713 [Synechococcus sp. SYN20]|nr:hypothetical protein SynSYN20_00713 [Synechococcus sp. SYN20]